MGSDMLRIRTVREPQGGSSGRRGLALLLGVLASAGLLLPTTLAVAWMLGDDVEFSGSQVWGCLLASATLAWFLSAWVVRSVDPVSTRGESLSAGMVCAVFGTALGALVLFLAFLAMLPGEG